MNEHLSTDERPPRERASAGQRHYIAPPGVSHAGGHVMPLLGAPPPVGGPPRAEQPTVPDVRPDTSLRHVGATLPPPALSQLATARVAVAALRSNPRDVDALEVLHRVLAAASIALTMDGSISPAAWNALRMLSEENGVLLAAHADAAKYLA